MNIVQVPERFVKSEWAGTETIILETSKRILRMGHHTEIVCPDALAERKVENIGGVRVTRVPYFYPSRGLGQRVKRRLDKKGGNLFSFELGRMLKEYPLLDLIHLHTAGRLGGVCRRAAVRRRIPYIVSVHGGLPDVPKDEAESRAAPTDGAFEWGRTLGRRIGTRKLFSEAAAIICSGEREHNELTRRFPRKRIVHLPNGVDFERFARGDGAGFRLAHDISMEAWVLLTAGQIDPQKNQLFVVMVLPELLRYDPSIHIVFIGPVTNDAYYNLLIRMARNMGVEEHITIIRDLEPGSRGLVDAYHSADMFLLPSIHEPLGIAILEAWAAGLPVIASNAGGVPSRVADGRDGMLFEPNDEVGFFQAFRALMKDHRKRRSLAEAGRLKACEQFGWDKITERLAAVYEEVINDHPSRQRKVGLFSARATGIAAGDCGTKGNAWATAKRPLARKG